MLDQFYLRAVFLWIGNKMFTDDSIAAEFNKDVLYISILENRNYGIPKRFSENGDNFY